MDPEGVRLARHEEIDFFKKMEIYRRVPLHECWEKTGKAPIPARWVDVDKGNETQHNYRSGLVAKEIKTYDCPEPCECCCLWRRLWTRGA